jgi:hypothetical protein
VNVPKQRRHSVAELTMHTPDVRAALGTGVYVQVFDFHRQTAAATWRATELG